MPVLQKLFSFISSFFKADTSGKYLQQTSPNFNLIDTLELGFLATSTSFLIGLIVTPTVFILSGGFELSGNNTIVDYLADFDAFGVVLLAVFFGPITEELAFRGFFSKTKWVFGTGSLLGLNYGLLLVFDVLLKYGLSQSLSLALTSLILLINTCWTIILLVSKQARYQKLFSKSMVVYFWLSLFVFGFIHLGNYSSLPFFLISFVIFLPQFFAGIWFMYARAKYGLISAMIVHAIHNFILSGGLVVLLLLPIPRSELVTFINSINDGTSGYGSLVTLLQQTPVALVLMAMFSVLYVVCGVVFVRSVWSFIVARKTPLEQN
jgi:hypothetical protein